MVRLWWSRSATPPAVPGLEVCPVARATDLFAMGSGDILALGDRVSAGLLDHLVRPRLAVGPLDQRARRARTLGWDVAILPPEALGVLEHHDQLVPFERGTLEPVSGVYWDEGGPTSLPPGAVGVVRMLLQAAGEPVSREELQVALGIAPVIETRAVDAAIHRLRGRLGRSAIQTHRGIGWSLSTARGGVRPATPVPAPVEIVLGDTRIDLDRRVVRRPDGEGRLTPLGVKALRALLEVDGPVDRSDLIGRLWTSGGDRARLDAVIHRLRKEVGARRILTVRGVGYRLDRTAPEVLAVTPGGVGVADVIRELSRSARVVIAGPLGVGKSHLASKVAGRLRFRVLDVHGVADERVLRRLAALDPEVDVCLDGLSSTAVLERIPERSGRLLCTARRGAGHAVLHMSRWTDEALAHVFPDADPHLRAGCDGRPCALAEKGPRILARVPPAWLPRVLEAIDAGGEVPPEMSGHPERQGVLLGLFTEHSMVPAFLEDAVVQSWSHDDWLRHAEVVRVRSSRARADGDRRTLEVLHETLSNAMEWARIHARERFAALCAEQNDAAHDLRRKRSSDDLREAVEMLSHVEPPNPLVASLWHSIGELTDSLEAFERAALFAEGETALLYRLEHALMRRGRQRDAAMETVAEVRAEIAKRPGEFLRVRAELMSFWAKESAKERLIAIPKLLGEIEVARWSGVLETNSFRTQLMVGYLHFTLADALHQLHEYRRARVAILGARGGFPDHVVDAYLARNEMAQGNFGRADRWLVKAAEAVTSQSVRHHYLLLRALGMFVSGDLEGGSTLVASLPFRKDQEFDGLVRAVERAIRDPDNGAAHMARGRAGFGRPNAWLEAVLQPFEARFS